MTDADRIAALEALALDAHKLLIDRSLGLDVYQRAFPAFDAKLRELGVLPKAIEVKR